MMKRILVFLAFLIVAPGLEAALYKQTNSHTLFNGEKLEEYQFENGFKVLLLPRHQAAVLTYQVWFNVGAVDEKMDPKLRRTGLAHLFEHMMFRGTPKYLDGEFDRVTAEIGGDKQNATTSHYRTNYFESVPSRQLEKVVELESDRMANLNLTGELFEKEKGAVVGELRLHQDRPMSIAFDELMKLVYTVSPFQWTVLGTEAEIKGFTLEEAKYYYKTFYAPNNALLIVVGDTTAATLLPMVEKYYGAMKRQEVPKLPLPEEPAQKKERRFEGTHRQATSELVVMAYRIPGIDSPDFAPFSLLGTHLSVGMEARLRKALVDKGIAVMANAGPDAKPNLFQVYIQLAEGKRAEEAIRIVDREIFLVQKSLISSVAFERALNQELLGMYNDITSNSRLGNILGESYTQSGNYLRSFQLIEEYRKLSPKDLQRVTKAHLRPENRSVVVIRPEKKT
ncbi:MAG: insulinase family protein [Deltaproteobacteria bacterium]|nr:insulinase family protein [Deltaproteobacteria bacterium]MBI3295139.1 insulinase family protein [Deltaproteobacteria bacterium]